MRKQLFTVLIFALFVFVSPSPSVLAQEEESSASLEETIKWLESKVSMGTFYIRAEGSAPDYMEYASTFSSPSRCSFVIKTYTNTPVNFGRAFISNDYNFLGNFSDADPFGVTVEEKKHEKVASAWVINIFASSGRAFKYNYGNMQKRLAGEKVDDNKFDSGATKAFLVVKDKELANRAAKALKHAIKLCGGKVDPF